MNKLKKKAIVITSSHHNSLKKYWYNYLINKGYIVDNPLVWVGEAKEARPNWIGGKDNLLTDTFDLVVIQWSTAPTKENTDYIFGVSSIMKNTLKHGGVVLQFFERTSIDTAQLIRQHCSNFSPVELVLPMGKNKICAMQGKEPVGLKLLDCEDINASVFISDLTKGTIKGYSTLKITGSNTKTHIKTLEGFPILTSRKVYTGLSIALAFGFCGSWNGKRDGLKNFQKIIDEIVQGGSVTLKVPLNTTDETLLDQSTKQMKTVEKKHPNKDFTLNSKDDESVSEGRKILRQHYRKERNPLIIKQAKILAKKKHGRLFCEICGFDYKKIYGEHGSDFIEGHHIKPVSQLDNTGEEVRIEDIVLVCANCHRMIHHKTPWLSLEEIKNLVISINGTRFKNFFES